MVIDQKLKGKAHFKNFLCGASVFRFGPFCPHPHSPSNRIGSVVLLRRGAGPALLSVAAGGRQRQLSHLPQVLLLGWCITPLPMPPCGS